MSDDDPDLIADLVAADVPADLIKRVIAALREAVAGARRGHAVEARLDDLRAEIEAAKRGLLEQEEQGDIFAQPLLESTRSRRGKGGRKPALDWAGRVKPEVLRVLNERGDFAPGRPDWDAQGRLEEHVESWCQDALETDVSIQTIRRQIRPWIKEWRQNSGSKH